MDSKFWETATFLVLCILVWRLPEIITAIRWMKVCGFTPS